MCPVCVVYIERYSVMADEWKCDHDEREQSFMQALADSIHRASHSSEFVDSAWGAAQFLDDSDLAADCGSPPYAIQVQHNVGQWSFLGLVNGQHLIGCENDEGAELRYVADISGVLPEIDIS
jgi:hypothetical protein